MDYAYFDTSALIKRYVDEPGRREVLGLLRKNNCVVSAADRAFWTVIEVSSEVLAAAETLSGTHPLRALDAIHVASAQLFDHRLFASPPTFTFVSADIQQATAAGALGLKTRYVGS